MKKIELVYFARNHGISTKNANIKSILRLLQEKGLLKDNIDVNTLSIKGLELEDIVIQNKIYWYYNRRYSETGCISFNLTKIIGTLKEDFVISKKELREIKKSLAETNSYIEFNYQIKYISFIKSQCNLFYILRYPNIIFNSEKEAIKTGLIYILNQSKGFHWNHVYTLCDTNWINKVLNTNYDDVNILNKIKKKDLKILWEERIEHDSWTTSNHIELANNCRVSLY